MTCRKSDAEPICVQCGKPLAAKSRALFCKECIHQNRLENMRQYRQKHKVKAEPGEYRPIACVGCQYYRHIYSGSHGCNYCLDTGNLRKILPADCYKHRGTPYAKMTNLSAMGGKDGSGTKKGKTESVPTTQVRE